MGTISIYWAGPDPVRGGVRAKIEWTEPGKQAVLGKAYRRFSPQFYSNAAGEVTGAPLNMGGLVNRAAFKAIAPIAARGTAPVDQRPAATEFLERIALVMSSADICFDEAERICAKAIPSKYESFQAVYRASYPQLAAAVAAQAQNHPFMVRAREIASKAAGLTLGKAVEQLVWSDEALYRSFRDQLGLVQAADSGSVAPPFNGDLNEGDEEQAALFHEKVGNYMLNKQSDRLAAERAVALEYPELAKAAHRVMVADSIKDQKRLMDRPPVKGTM